MKTSKAKDAKITRILSELKQEYRQKFPAKIQLLKDLTQKQDWAALQSEFHKLKGTGRTYGYPEVSLLCQALEEASQQGLVDAAQMQKVFSVFARMTESWEDGHFFHPQRDPEAQELLALKGKAQ